MQSVFVFQNFMKDWFKNYIIQNHRPNSLSSYEYWTPRSNHFIHFE